MNRFVTGALCIWGGLLSLKAQAPSPPDGAGVPGSPLPASPSPALPGVVPSTSTAASPNIPRVVEDAASNTDPLANIVTFDGKGWKITNQKAFRSRLEKFLNAPDQSDADFQDYQVVIGQVMGLLGSSGYQPSNLDKAWGLLHKASNYPIDAHLCDALADAVYSAWLAGKAQDRLDEAGKALEKQRRDLEWDAQVAAESARPDTYSKPADKEGAAAWAEQQKEVRDQKLQPYAQRLAEVNAMIAANKGKSDASELQAKVEFQSLMVQFFMQRRFQHVLMATRFYRFLFGDGDTEIHVADQGAYGSSAAIPSTLGVMDSLSDEAIADVKEGAAGFLFLLGKKELVGATDRLSDTFVVGEYLPALRGISRDDKRRALLFMQKQSQLLSAIELRDYALAENLIPEIQQIAVDFDPTSAQASIQTAKAVSAMHLEKAKTAASNGDKATLDQELKAATEVWPRNPELARVASAIFAQADAEQQALNDLEHLISQHDYRKIFEDRARFIAVTVQYRDRRQSLDRIVDEMQTMEAVITRSNAIEQGGNHAGAWEEVEREARQYPDDPKLNEMRARLTVEAADFVRAITMAEAAEKEGRLGVSLSWYLKSQALYSESAFAKDGVARLAQKIVGD